MKNNGFYITALIATGKGVPDSRIDFEKRCNLIFGKSETGKTHVLHLIEFLLGKKNRSKDGTNPQMVPEGKGYDCFYLEIAKYENDEPYTIQRKLNSKSVYVKPVKYTFFSDPEIRSDEYSTVSKKNAYSDFLLRLIGYDNKVEVKKSATDKAQLSFSTIRHLILASENRVIAETPIFNPTSQFAEATREKSLIYLLTSGEDDSNFEPEDKKDIQRAKIHGKMELLNDVIKQKEELIFKIGDVNYADFTDEAFVKQYKTELAKTDSTLNGLYQKRNELEKRRNKLMSKQMFVEAFLSRIKLLNQHYTLDIERYDFLYQGHQIFEALGDNAICPLCKSHLDPKHFTEAGFAESLKAEYEAILQRKAESEQLITVKEEELSNLKLEIDKIHSEKLSLFEEIKTIEIQIGNIRSILERYQANIESKTRLTDLQEETQRFRADYKRLADELKKVGQVASRYIRETNIKDEFCDLLQKKLAGWEVGDSQTVVFDEQTFDFILGGKPRLSCGKGTRGVTCTAILMTLVEYCILHDIPFTRTLIIDSPITAHFSDASLKPEETTQNKFFRYCNDNIKNYQLIIIDNKSPNEEEREILSNIHYIEFSESGRPGFYPAKPTI